MATNLREPRPEKVAVVDEVRARLSESSASILTEYRGLAVSEMEQLRRALTEVGGDYKVYKNTLVRRAAQESGLEVLEPLLEGPTAIAFVRDDVAAVAKVLRDFSRTNPSLVVKGGLIGQSLLDAKTAAALAELPSRDVLLAQIAGIFAAPMQRFAGLLAALPQKLAFGLSALIEQRGGVVDAPTEAEEIPETESASTTEEPSGAVTPVEESVEAEPKVEASEAEVSEVPATEVEASEAEVSATEMSETAELVEVPSPDSEAPEATETSE